MKKYTWWWLCLMAFLVLVALDVAVWLFTGTNIFYAGDDLKVFGMRAMAGLGVLMCLLPIVSGGFHLKAK